MEAVAPNAGRVQLLGQCEALSHRRRRVVEGRVEAGHLRERRVELAEEPDGPEVVRLMQRRERDEGLEPRQHRVVYPHRAGEYDAAVHHPVSDACQRSIF